MEITSANLDDGISPASRRNLSRVKFEMVPQIEEPQRKKPGFFAGLLKSLGNFSPLAFLSAPFTGPMGIVGGAALAGAGALGNKASANAMRSNDQDIPAPVSYPGFGGGFGSGGSSFDPTLELISTSRDNAAGDAVHRR